MIAVIISAISVLTVVIVSVYLITNSYKQDAERSSALTKIVKDINKVNETNIQLENTQSKALTTFNTKLIGMSNDMSSFKATVADFGKTVSTTNAKLVSSSNLIKGISEKVNALNTTLTKDIPNQLTTNRIGLDGNTFSMSALTGSNNIRSLNMSFSNGSTVSLQHNSNGNVSFIVPEQKEFRVYSGSNLNAGLTMTGNILGVGKVPQQLQGVPFQVNGAVWTKDGLVTTIDTNSASVMSFSNNMIAFNSKNDFYGVHVGSTAFLRNDSNEWLLNTTSSKDANDFILKPSNTSNGSGSMRVTSEGRMTLIGSNAGITMRGATSAKYNPNNLPTHFAFGTSNAKNIIRGDTDVYGDLTSVGSLLLGMPSDVGNQSRSGIGTYGNNATRVFTTDSGGSLHLSTSKEDGTFSDYVTMANDGQVTVSKMLTAGALCSGTAQEKQCLTANEIQQLKRMLATQT